MVTTPANSFFYKPLKSMKSLLFTSEMVQAILAGKKTQTRRIVKNQFPQQPDGDSRCIESAMYHCDRKIFKHNAIIYVRETFAKVGDRIFYKADNNDIENAGLKGMYNFKWTPSIYMPQALSRIALRITAIRVERLQNISESEALAEGIWHNVDFKGDNIYRIKNSPQYYYSAVPAYKELWEKINGQGSWDLNPLVYVITFEVLEYAPSTYN